MKQVSDILIDMISRLTKIEDRLDKLEAMQMKDLTPADRLALEKLFSNNVTAEIADGRITKSD